MTIQTKLRKGDMVICRNRIILAKCEKCGAEFIRADIVPDPCRQCGGKMVEVREVSEKEFKNILMGKKRK